MINVLKYGLSSALVVLCGFAAIDLTNLNGQVPVVDIEYTQTITPSVTDSIRYQERVILNLNNNDLYVISRDPKEVSVDSLHYYVDDNPYPYKDSSVIPRFFLIAFGLGMLSWFLYENRTKTGHEK